MNTGYFRRRIKRTNLCVIVTAFSVLSATDPVGATQRNYGILSNQSSIAVSGDISSSVGTSSIHPQGTGSLSTTYSGIIKTDRAGNNLAFLSGSVIDANTNGNWQPLANGSDGSAAADYGGKATFLIFITVNFAGRNLVAGLTSGALPIDAGGHFDLSTTNLTFSNGSIAYRSSTGDPAASSSIVGKSGALTGSGSLSSLVQGSLTTETLTLPVNSSFLLQPDDATTINLTLTGQLVATSTFVTPLPGDYNQNGIVDTADFVVWRKKVGSGISLPNDDTTGVGPDDYTRWRENFGQTLGSNGNGSDFLIGSAVPEASSVRLLIVAMCLGGVFRRYR